MSQASSLKPQNLSPGSYIFPHIEPVLQATRLLLGFGGQASYKLQAKKERLHAHPDFYLISSEGSIGIDVIREVGHFLRIKPVASAHKILVIENFHLATVEAQNAFLKTFEEPPPYAYIFLVTPYIDRLLKTIISRAQVMTGISNFQFPISKQILNSKFKIQNIIAMSIGERFLWLEDELKGLDDKIQIKLKLLEIIDAFLSEGVILLRKVAIPLEALEYLKDAKWKIEQGFPNPKLLLEGFLLKLRNYLVDEGGKR